MCVYKLAGGVEPAMTSRPNDAFKHMLPLTGTLNVTPKTQYLQSINAIKRLNLNIYPKLDQIFCELVN